MQTNENGEKFLQEVREIIEECSQLETPARSARVALFALCVMLDDSEENIGANYVLSVKNKNGGIDPVKFFHHDL